MFVCADVINKKVLMMDKKVDKWTCEPCGHKNDAASDVCMVCNNPSKLNKIKIVKKGNKKIITKAE